MSNESFGQLRHEMDILNEKLLDIFLRRMELSCIIMREKAASGMPAYDQGREDAILREMTALAGPDNALYVERLFQTVLELCRARYHAPGSAL